MPTIALASLGALTLLNYWARRDVRYPPFLMSAVWLLILILYYSLSGLIDAISAACVTIFALTVISFTVGGQLSLRWLQLGTIPFKRQKSPTVQTPAHPAFRRFLLFLSLILLPILISKAMSLAAESPSVNFWVSLRIQLSLPDSSGYGIIGNASIISFVTTFLYAIELSGNKREKREYYLSIITSFIYAVLGTGRTPIFLILVVLMGIGLMRGRFTITKLIAGSLVFLLFFGAFAIVLTKGGDTEASWSENLSSMGESLLTYATGALPAFDTVVQEKATPSHGENTFIGALNLFYRLEGRELLSPIQEAVAVPFSINVYTGIHPVYKDFGIPGVILSFLLIGAASTYCYVKALTGDPLHIYCYALSLFPLLFVVFSDQYFAPMLSWVKYLLVGYFYFKYQRTTQRIPAVSTN